MYYIFTSCKFWLLNVKFVFAREKSRAFFFNTTSHSVFTFLLRPIYLYCTLPIILIFLSTNTLLFFYYVPFH